ncbi:AAA family ATPase [Devosia lacusdianchii]|uniref:AAA family ATPase n=1 Tax=Devosia lacusdianchii TaxID=2917991 RepID=UPI001F05A0E1|nr:AAA family ATPase [Devosia sp. JXJ CY 41]
MSDLRFPDALLDRIRDAVPISEVVSQYVSWDNGKSQPGRGDLWACCPFHAERDPSFHVLDQEGIYKCFVCSDSAGDVFDFLVQISGISFVEAVKVVAGMAGIDTDQPNAQQTAGAPRPALPPAKASQRPAKEPKGPKRKREGQWTIFKAYDYEIDGVVQYQNVRIQFKMPDGSWELDPDSGKPDKDFRQRRPSGLPDGSWVWGLKAGTFMRRRAGEDWRKLDETVLAEWGSGERLTLKDDVPHGIYRRTEVELAIEQGRTILFLEGEKAVDASWALGQPATCNSGGGENFDESIIAIFRGARVVASPDNDPQRRDNDGELVFHPDGRPSFKGKDHAEQFCAMARKKAAFVGLLELPGLPLKGDIFEWIAAGGTIEQLQALIDHCPPWRPRPPQSKFGAIGLDQLHQPHLKHEFLIDGFLDRRGVAMMPGASGSAKTFLTLEMGMCIALNRDFWGMQVKPGLVLYQAGEGKEGVTKRIDGWLLDRDVPPSAEVPFKVLPRKVNLFVDDKDTDDLIEEGKAWSEYYEQPVRLMIIDTFNKAITGANENAGQDMGRVLSRLERISEALDCAVLVPMHKSKQGDMRGHTSLMGDASNVLNVTKLEIRDGNGRQIRTVSLDKNKDGEGGHPMRFVLRQIVLGEEENGKPRTTCVVDRPNGDDEALVAEGKLSLNQTLFLQTLRDSIDIEGEDAPLGVTGVPRGKRVVQYKAFAARLWNKWPFTAPEHEVEKRKKEFSTQVGAAGKRLVAHGYVERHNDTGLIWWTGKSDRPPRQPKPVEKPGAGISPAVMKELKEEDVPF